MDINTAIVRQAIDGLEEGYRVIASHLNCVFEKRGLDFRIVSDKKQEADTLDHAREMMRRALPKLPSLDVPSDLSTVSPWTFGFVNDLDHCPENVTLSDDSNDDLISLLCAFLSGDSCDGKDLQYWNESIIQKVEARQLDWRNLLNSLLVPVDAFPPIITLNELWAIIEGNPSVATCIDTVRKWSRSPKFPKPIDPEAKTKSFDRVLVRQFVYAKKHFDIGP